MNIQSNLLHVSIIGFATILDQLVKYLIETKIGYYQQIDLLPFLALFRTHNDGIAFSMLSSLSDGSLIMITLSILVFMFYLWWTSPPTRKITRFGFSLIIGGAIGNLVDRTLHGYVVDYVLFHISSWSFAIFNLADSFITIGAGLIILEELLLWKHKLDRQ